jgi:hypothetical protein
MGCVNAVSTESFNRNEKKFTAMKNDDKEWTRSIILKILWWHLLDECRGNLRKICLVCWLPAEVRQKLTERKYEWNLSMQFFKFFLHIFHYLHQLVNKRMILSMQLYVWKEWRWKEKRKIKYRANKTMKEEIK